MERDLLATPNPSGRAPWANGLLKTSILNWGLSDAVIALGPMKSYTRLAIWCGFEEIAAFDPDAPPTDWNSPARSCEARNNALEPRGQFIVITESLGSFVLLDAFADAAFRFDRLRHENAQQTPERGAALQFIVKRSDNIYFFANQFALLELARVQGVPENERTSPGPNAVVRNAMREWAGSGPGKQLVAFDDPGDILTFNVPDFCEAPGIDAATPCQAEFRNIYVHNDFSWFGAFERPDHAHTWYSRNNGVLKTIFGK
jgi:hypothetical protein